MASFEEQSTKLKNLNIQPEMTADNDLLESNGDNISTNLTIVKPTEQIAESNLNDDENIILRPPKEYVSLVFLGDAESGKSTICGHLLYLTGNIGLKEFEENIQKKKRKNKIEPLTFSRAHYLDGRPEEITLDYNRKSFETEQKHFTLLDVPGYKAYINNMISALNQADVAILVISARYMEFEDGLENGQTLEQASFIKASGFQRLLVVINKMDSSTAHWSKLRYEYCCDKLIPFLHNIGFNPETDIHCMPCSGLRGAFLKAAAHISQCPWYREPTLLQYLTKMPPLDRKFNRPLRLIVLDKDNQGGTYIIGKIVSGIIIQKEWCMLMPNKKKIKVEQIIKDNIQSNTAVAGEYVKLKVGKIKYYPIGLGSVLCSPENLCKWSNKFVAQILVGDINFKIYANSYWIMDLYSQCKVVSIQEIFGLLDKENQNVCINNNPSFIESGDLVMARIEVRESTICMENFKDFPQLGRFILRDWTQIIGQGKIMNVFPMNVVNGE